MTVAPPTVAPFDVAGPLPTGVAVLEASAGTGKTFTIAALATRYVADGLPLENLLLVTFTRMATSELRDRVRERMVSAEQGLGRFLLTGALPPDDEVLGVLGAGPDKEVQARHQRLVTALSGFDAATIATTHGFCQHVLNGLGIAGDLESDATFVEDSRAMVDEVVADLYVRKFHGAAADEFPFSLDQALTIAHKAVSNTDADLQPADAAHDSPADLRCRLARRVRTEVDRRRRLAAVLTFDDLLTRLREMLADPVRGETACRRLRARYRVALVDEFQDTDPIQWEILRRAFVDTGSGATLVLIGDPKQAIYAFRGADVYAYLDAARVAGSQSTLDVNWRSDRALLDAYDVLFDGAKLGHEHIVYRPVAAAPPNQTRRLSGAPVDAALRVRVLHRADGLVKLTPQKYANVDASRGCVARDLASDVVRLLSSRARIARPPGETGGSPTVNVRPGHIAVLVHRNRDAELVRDALENVGVPVVINGAGSIFSTPAAGEWLRLLQALERPSSGTAARSAALTPFLGWTAERVATVDDAELEGLHARLHRWATVLRRQGVAALFETVSLGEGLAGRVLRRSGGERELTDLRHTGELLHGVATAEQLGATALTGWLRERVREVDDDADTEDRSRRLESDAEAVQVLTIWRSKGLEFPFVYCPFLNAMGYIWDTDPPVFHDPSAGDRRTIDVGGEYPGWHDSRQLSLVERRGEDLRLTYVALTRAMHQAVVWWTPTWESRHSALGRLVFFGDAAGNVAPEGTVPPPDPAAVARFESMAAAAPGCISVERVDGGDDASWTPAASPPVALSANRFDRTLDPRWRRTSYSGITSGAHEARVASEAEEVPATVDEVLPSSPVGQEAGDAGLRSVGLLLAAMPGGADVGTFLHGVLEDADFAAADLDGELVGSLGRAAVRGPVDIGDPAAVVAGLRAALETPLGPLVGDVRLRDIGRSDRVDELSFELPLVGGDVPTGSVAVAEIGRLLEEYLGAGDPMVGYAARLRDPSLLTDLRGYLSGSLDLVFRTPDQRYAVVDYKTNWLGVDGEPVSAWHYRPEALLDAMFRAHYPLQALLYTVALHRYLRWRLPGYDPDRNLAGVLYLFVRGMTGADTPVVDGQRCGVFAWRPPVALVEALSDLLDRGTVPA
ncbi:MAG: exodeoxyribonuclease beta subunit [Actinomycetota bacterium]|nr:exodeoxyribonuclease beta subunit [Actinomycetota bacterium]